MRRRIFSLLRRFGRDRRAVAAIEFAILGPVLVALLLGCVALFVLFRESQDAEKATFTVADILSRKTSVDNAYLGTANALFLKMLPAPGARTEFRVSSLKKASGAFTVDWSYAAAPLGKLVAAQIPLASLPLVADGDSLLLVETRVPYEPMFASVGLPSGRHVNTAAVRPRFTAAITKSD